MDYNFHAHTYLCHHASGTPEEFVLKAIEGNIKYYGFSEHAPFLFPDGYQSHYRLFLEDLDEYKETVFRLREKYKDQIEIFYGFEMEYYPAHFEKMLKTVKDADAEYLILGQHFLYNEHPDGFNAFRKVDKKEDFEHFTECVLSGIKSGVFTYVAHPDTIDFDDYDVYKTQVEKICKASKEYDVPLEINFQGISLGRDYPKEKFWEIAGKIGCPVTFGFDAHHTSAACDLESLPKAMEIVKKYNLNYIGKPKLKKL